MAGNSLTTILECPPCLIRHHRAVQQDTSLLGKGSALRAGISWVAKFGLEYPTKLGHIVERGKDHGSDLAMIELAVLRETRLSKAEYVEKEDLKLAREAVKAAALRLPKAGLKDSEK